MTEHVIDWPIDWNNIPKSMKVGDKLRIRLPESHNPYAKDCRYCACKECIRIRSQTVYAKPMENKSMTRDEALKAITPHFHNQDLSGPKTSLAILETLGLLKFDEPVKSITERVIDEARKLADEPGAIGIRTEALKQLLNIIDNKYDDIKCVKIGVNTTVRLGQISNGLTDNDYNGKLLKVSQ